MSYDPQPGSQATQGLYERIGAALANLGSDYVSYFNDFLENKLPPGWSEGTGAGGSSAAVTGVSGGHSNLITSAGAGGIVQHTMAGSVAGLANVNTTKWYFAWRQKVPNAVTANTRCGSGLYNGVNTVLAGAYGGLSTTNFVLQYGGLRTGSALTLSAIDTAYHVFEAWHPGDGTIHARMDGGAEATPGTAPNNADASALSEAYNNGNASDHRLIRDWCVYLIGRT